MYFINSALPYEVKKKQSTEWCNHLVMQEKKPLSFYCNYIVVGFLGIYVQLRLRTNILHVIMQHTSLLHSSVWQLWQRITMGALGSFQMTHTELLTDGTAMNTLYFTCYCSQWSKSINLMHSVTAQMKWSM